jgi:uncharacterized radical SAM superfamily protein
LLADQFPDLKDQACSGVAISLKQAADLLKIEDEQQIKELMSVAREASYLRMNKRVNFYYSSHYFPALSLTGSECALRCKHCETRLLQNLTAAPSPEKLVCICGKIAAKGARGVLITGGCTLNGKVALGRFLDAIALVKKKTNLMVIAHTGILDFNEAEKLVAAKIDGAAVDVVGLPEITQAVYGIEITPKDYAGTLASLEKAGMPIISPHVCVGLNFGNLSHELASLNLISGIKPTTVVITALMPLRGTPMERIHVKAFDVVKVVALARLIFPDVPITLGCARSKGDDRTLIERLAIQAGVTSIAIPSDRTLEYAKTLGLKTESYAACCAVPPAPSLRLITREEDS